MAVRGYAKWNPGQEPRYWVARTNEVLTAYEDYWPLSVRQIFYRLVADHGYGKTEAAYNQLTQWLSRARRAGYLPWQAIRDGGLGRTIPPNFFDTAEDYLGGVRRFVEDNLQVNRQRGQDHVIELWCEAGGMVPILEDIARPYSCQVNTGGGYDSVTAKHNLAVRVMERARRGLRTHILHVGDFDPSGENMCEVLHEDALHMAATQVVRAGVADTRELQRQPDWIPAHVGFANWVFNEGSQDGIVRWATGYFEVERVALTGEQVIERGVETAPPKPSDSRMRAFAERNAWVAEELGTDQISAQLEALTPPELRELISEKIEEHLDMNTYERALQEEQEVRDELLERLT